MSDVEGWTRACGLGAVAAALPTVVWRAVVGAGAHLGTPASWRRAEAIPGSGVAYVFGLSAVQLVAALATFVLIVPGADRIPVGGGRRWPRGLVFGAALAGAAVLAALCLLSGLAWSRVDPFRDAPVDTAWTYLCWACYAAAPLWPVLLAATALGYRRANSDRRPRQDQT